MWGMAKRKRFLFTPYNVGNPGTEVHRAKAEGELLTLCGRSWEGYGRVNSMVTCRICLRVLRRQAVERGWKSGSYGPDQDWETYILPSDGEPA